MNGTEKTQCVPAPSKLCETRAIAKLAKYAPDKSACWRGTCTTTSL